MDTLNIFKQLITRENLTLGLAIFGAYGTFRSMYKNRFALKVTYISQLALPNTKIGIMYFNLLIENKSTSPVSISRIFISIGNIEGEFLHEPQRVYSSTENMSGPQETTSTYSIALPTRIEGLGAIGGYYKLQIPTYISEEELLNSKVFITIFTNRGKRKFHISLKPSTTDALTGTGIHPYHK